MIRQRASAQVARVANTEGPLAERPARTGPVTLLPFQGRDAGFFDGTRFAGTGWPGAHGPWRAGLARSGRARGDGPGAAGPGEVAEDSGGLPLATCELAGLPALAKGPYVPGRSALGGGGRGGHGNAALVPRKMRGCAMITEIPPAVATTAGPAGAAGSDEDRVILRDGSAIVVRPLATGDVAAIAAWFEGLGPETRHARFLASVAMLDERTRSLLAQVDHRDHEALTAVTPDGAVVGIARYIRLQQSSTAEVAVAVADHWCGRGIATLLLAADRGAGSRGGHRLPDRPVPCLEHRRPGPSQQARPDDNHPAGSGGHRGPDQPGAAPLRARPGATTNSRSGTGHPGLDIRATRSPGITRPSGIQVNSGSSPPAAAMITSSGATSSSPALRAARIERTTPPAWFTGVTTP